MGTKALLALALFASTLVGCLPDTPGARRCSFHRRKHGSLFRTMRATRTFCDPRRAYPRGIRGGAYRRGGLLDYRPPTFEDELGGLSRDATYLVYCRSGNRSADAVEGMARRGFTRIYELAGGIQAWERAGLPVEE